MTVCGRPIDIEAEFAVTGHDIEVSEGPFPTVAEQPTMWALEELVIEHLDALKVFDLNRVYEDAAGQAIDYATDYCQDR